MSQEKKKITFKELVEVRKEEMRGMRPGLTSEITDGIHTVRVNSPDVFERSTFKMDR